MPKSKIVGREDFCRKKNIDGRPQHEGDFLRLTVPDHNLLVQKFIVFSFAIASSILT